MNILSINGEDICGISKTLSDAVNKYTPHKSKVLTGYMSVRDIPYDYAYGHNCNEQDVRDMLNWADILHFNDYLPGDFAFGKIDLWDYTKGKAIIFTEHGTHLRTNEKVQYNLERKGWKLLITMPILFNYVDDTVCRTEWLPFPIPTEDPAFTPMHPDIKYGAFTVVHAPGEPHRWPIKDTNFLVETVDSINGEKGGSISLKVLSDMPWKKSLLVKQKSHVCFDHMQGYYGVNSAEAMSMGLPSITNLNYEYEYHARQRYGGELPFVRADKVTLRGALLSLREDPVLMEQIGWASRDYAIKVHDLRTVVLPQLLNAYKQIYKHG